MESTINANGCSDASCKCNCVLDGDVDVDGLNLVYGINTEPRATPDRHDMIDQGMRRQPESATEMVELLLPELVAATLLG